jgi:hypothetical protein
LCATGDGDATGDALSDAAGVGDGDGGGDGEALTTGTGVDVTLAKATTCAGLGRRFFGEGDAVGARVGAGVAAESVDAWSRCSEGCEAHAARARAVRAASNTVGRYTAGHHSLPPFSFRLLGAARKATNGSRRDH